MKTILLMCLLGVVLPLQAAQTLSLGIFPYLSAAELVDQHKPLIDYLSHRLHRPVIIVSAGTFPDFLERTREGRYDLVLTAPHMGALSILRDGYVPLAVTENRLQAVIASNRKSSWQSLNHLQQARFIFPPRKAIVSLLAADTLKQAGLDIDRLAIQYTRSHNNALQSVLKGRHDVAVFSSPTYLRYIDKGGSELRVLARSTSIPGNFVIANAGLDEQTVSQLRQALLDFSATSAGRDYFKRTRQKSFRPITEADMKRLRPYIRRIFGY